MKAPVRRRTRARELAMQFLYTVDLRGADAFEGLEPFVDHHTRRMPDKKGQAEVASYAVTLVEGVWNHLDDLNSWIEGIASNWRLDRMAIIDRNILRMAVYELLFHQDVPFKVVINEAIDIAKRYSTPQSGSFVNGILDKARILIEEQRRGGVDAPLPPSRQRPGELPGRPASEVRDAGLDPEIPVPTPRPRSARGRPERDH